MDSVGHCTGPITAAATSAAVTQTATTAASRRGTWNITAAIATYVVGDAVVDGCGASPRVVVHVALRGLTELLGAIGARNVAHAV